MIYAFSFFTAAAAAAMIRAHHCIICFFADFYFDLLALLPLCHAAMRYFDIYFAAAMMSFSLRFSFLFISPDADADFLLMPMLIDAFLP